MPVAEAIRYSPTPTGFSAAALPEYRIRDVVPDGLSFDQRQASMAHLRNVRIVNEHLTTHVRSEEQLHAFLSGDKSAYPEYMADEVDRLNANRREFAESVKTPEAMLIRSQIEAKYKRADQTTAGKSKEERAAARFATSESEEAVMDYDNTLTDESKIKRVNETKPGHPGALVADGVLAKFGSIHGFGETYTALYPASFQYVAHEMPEVFFDAGRTAPMREGAGEYLSYLKDKNIPLRFASANVNFTVWGTLSQFDHPADTDVWAMTPDSTSALEKDAVIVTEAMRNPQNAIIYIGDGSSDKPSIDAKDVVAAYFALEGSSFAKELEESKVLYFTYNSLTDVVNKLEQIKSLMPHGAASEHTLQAGHLLTV